MVDICNDYKEIWSEDIRCFFDLEANIKKLVISKKGSVEIKTESNLIKMSSDLIGIYFEKDTGKIETIKNHLLEYCKQDTIAMVKLHRQLVDYV